MTNKPDFIQMPTTPGRPETPPSMQDHQSLDVVKSVLVWKSAKTAPADGELYLLVYNSDSGIMRVAIAAYSDFVDGWRTPYGELIRHPIAYAEVVLPIQIADLTPGLIPRG